MTPTQAMSAPTTRGRSKKPPEKKAIAVDPQMSAAAPVASTQFRIVSSQ
jgi:hypothetical protein